MTINLTPSTEESDSNSNEEVTLTGLDRLIDEVTNESQEETESLQDENNLSDQTQNNEEQSYTPNCTYEANGHKMEFDPVLSQLINTEEAEGKLRDLYEHSHRVQESEAKLSMFEENIGKLQHLKENDISSLFKVLDVPEDQILEYAMKIAEHRGLPPEKQQEIERQHKLQAENQDLTHRLDDLEQQNMEASKQQFMYQFDQALSRQDVADFSRRYDEAVGIEGSFKNDVVAYGQAIANQNGEILSPEDAVNAVMKKYQAIGNAPSETFSPMVGSEKPSIPTISGSTSQSPVRKRFTSLDEIRNYANQLK